MEPREPYSSRREIPTGKGVTLPRWLLAPTGALSALIGLAGLFYRSGDGAVLVLNPSKGTAYGLFGMLLLWVASTWSYPVRRRATRLLGFAVTGLGLFGLTRRGSAALRVRQPWEALLHVLVGASFLAAGFWARPFDYRD